MVEDKTASNVYKYTYIKNHLYNSKASHNSVLHLTVLDSKFLKFLLTQELDQPVSFAYLHFENTMYLPLFKNHP